MVESMMGKATILRLQIEILQSIKEDKVKVVVKIRTENNTGGFSLVAKATPANSAYSASQIAEQRKNRGH